MGKLKKGGKNLKEMLTMKLFWWNVNDKYKTMKPTWLTTITNTYKYNLQPSELDEVNHVRFPVCRQAGIIPLKSKLYYDEYKRIKYKKETSNIDR